MQYIHSIHLSELYMFSHLVNETTHNWKYHVNNTLLPLIRPLSNTIIFEKSVQIK